MAELRCTTADCGRIAKRLVFVEEAEPPDWFDYCEPCAALLKDEEVACPNCESTAEAVEKALGYLSMTQCPYFDHEGTCDRGCHQEPSCTVDTPIRGWVGEAIHVLESVASRKERNS